MGGDGGHYANVPTQMQRSSTGPYGGLSFLLSCFVSAVTGAPNQLYSHQLPSRLPPGSVDERLNGNGPSPHMNLNYGISRPASTSESGIQYDSNSFPVLNAQQANRYSHATVVGPQFREEEFPNLNEDDFPALPGSGTSHKITSLRSELGEDSHHDQHQPSNGSSSRPPSSNQMFYSNASGSGLHPPSPGLYASSNSTPNVTPNRPKPLTLSPKLNPSGDSNASLRPEAKYGLLGLLDVIRLTDRVSVLPLGLLCLSHPYLVGS